MNKLKGLQGLTILSKAEQKTINGGSMYAPCDLSGCLAYACKCYTEIGSQQCCQGLYCKPYTGTYVGTCQP